jgi:hypothetical protein
MFVIFVVNNLLFFLLYSALTIYNYLSTYNKCVISFSPTLVLNLCLVVENLFSYKKFIIKRKLYIIATVMTYAYSCNKMYLC